MIPRTVPFGLLHSLSLEINTKSIRQEKSAFLITNLSLIKPEISYLAEENVVGENPVLSRNRVIPTHSPLFFLSIVDNFFLKTVMASKEMCLEAQSSLCDEKFGQRNDYVKTEKKSICC